MKNHRPLWVLTICLMTTAALAAPRAFAQNTVDTPEADQSAAMTPAEAYRILDAGYRTYRQRCDSGCMGPCFACARDTTATGQHPYAGVLTCMDSRTTPEYIFTAAPGQLFVFRDGGNVADSVIVGSMEYAVLVKNVPLLVIMGHTNCGAIAGACDSNTRQPAALSALLAMLRPAIRATAASGFPSKGCNLPFLDSAASTNVRMVIARIMKLSPGITQRVREGKLAIMGCRFNVASGALEWLTPPPKQ